MESINLSFKLFMDARPPVSGGSLGKILKTEIKTEKVDKFRFLLLFQKIISRNINFLSH